MMHGVFIDLIISTSFFLLTWVYYSYNRMDNEKKCYVAWLFLCDWFCFEKV